MGGVAKEVEDTEARNLGTIEIVFKKNDNTYNTMNPSEQTYAHMCHKCHIKDHVNFKSLCKHKKPQWRNLLQTL